MRTYRVTGYIQVWWQPRRTRDPPGSCDRAGDPQAPTRPTQQQLWATQQEGAAMRLVIAECAVDYSGRLSAHLPLARRVLMIKSDGSVLVHSDGGSYKPLNWMSPPCVLKTEEASGAEAEAGATEVWTVRADKTDDMLRIVLHEVFSDISVDMGGDTGLN